MNGAASHRVAPRRHSSLRRALFRGVEHAARLCGGRAFYRWRHLGRGRLLEREECVRVPELDPVWHGLTIAQLSDLHAGPFLGRGDLSHVVDCVRARRVDLLAVTGDFLTHGVEDSLLVLDELAAMPAPLGRFAVLGNHDYRGRREAELVAACAARGIRVLIDESLPLERGAARLWIRGLGDLEEARTLDPRAGAQAIPEGDADILLAHHPRAGRSCLRPRTRLVLSGHTHGMQLDLPILRRLGPAHPGLRYRSGPALVVVSRGLGVIGFPLRVGAPAEVVFLRLECA
jgi:predicted MPP superfamily phosphohydrolase